MAPELKEWLDNHNITYTIRKDLLVIPGFGRMLVQQEYEHVFRVSKEGEVVFNAVENIEFLKADEIFYICFPFGNRWYYIDVREPVSTQQFRILRHIGCPVETSHKCDFYPLGIHSGYELLNGSSVLKDWCAKVKFLGYGGCAVAEVNTLASSLDLQIASTDKGLKYAFGYSLTINIGNDRVGAKIYSSTQEGFTNLLKIQKIINVDNIDTKEIGVIDLLNCARGNVIVFDKFSGHWLASNKKYLEDFINSFESWVFFQVDTSEYSADRIDSVVIKSIKDYFDAFYLGDLKYDLNVRPILIQDVYYLDKEDYHTKIILNKIDAGAAHKQSHHQYLKTLDELYDEFRALFSEKYDDGVFYDMCESTADIVENASALYDLTENYAPKYDMTPKEIEKYGTTLNMFHQLIEEGFRKLVPEGEEELYRERLEYEKYVIESTDNVDYCLITWDELNWARENGILTGIGRGSAGGSVLLYLLGITKIDPIKYGLIFERFLLPERGGLIPTDVTKIQPSVMSKHYYEVELEGGKVLKFDRDAEFLVKRGEEQVRVFADELQPYDDIVWDRRDELFYID